MDLGLSNRRALVFGASRGLGAAIAATLAAEGAHVFAASRSGGPIEGLSADIASRIEPLVCDLSDRASIDALADRLLAEGGVDILINNCGGPPAGPISKVSAEVWVAQFQTMAAHIFHLSARFLPPMQERKWGRIVTVASSGVEQPIPNLGISNGVRAAVVGWSKTLAGEVAASGVTVNVVLPGRIHTDRVDQLDDLAAGRQGKTREEVAAASRGGIPAGRYGQPQEFADVVAFLASERASYVTGGKIRVDGGMIRSV